MTQLVFIIERTNFLSRAVWSKSDFDLVENTCTYVNQDTRFWSKFDFLTKLEIGPEFQNYNHRPKYWPITLAKKPNGIVHGRTQTTRLCFVKNKNSGKKTRFVKKKSFFFTNAYVRVLCRLAVSPKFYYWPTFWSVVIILKCRTISAYWPKNAFYRG